MAADENATPTDPTQTDAEQADEQQDETPVFDVNVEDAGTLKKKVTVKIPRDHIDGKFDEMFGELSRTAQVPGFRVGHAPKRLIEKRFAKEVGEDVRNNLIGESIGQALDQAGLRTLGEPDIDLENIELPESGDMDYSFEVEVAPEFELPELKGIAIEKPLLEITDDRIDGTIDQIRQSRSTYDASDGPAAAGDMVVADAIITGEECDAVRRPGTSLRVGPGQVEGLALVELGDALTGKKAGDKAELTTKAPETHPNEQWQDKELTVLLEIEQINARQLPELNDAFAEAIGLDNLAELRQYVSNDLNGRLEQDVRRAMRNQACQYLIDSTEFDLPEGVVARHTERALQRRYISLLQQGMPREQIDEKLTELQADAANQARQELTLTFILGKIAETDEIEVTEDEINSRIAQMAQSYNRRPERLRQELTQDGTIQQVAVALREEKVLDKLLESAKITEVAPEQAAEKAVKKAAKKKTAKKTVSKAADDKPTEKKAAKKKAASKAAKKSADDKPAEKKAAKKKTAKKTASKAAKKTTKKAKDD